MSPSISSVTSNAGKCPHADALWADNWRIYCPACGAVLLRPQYAGSRRNKKGGVVSQMDINAASNQPVGGAVRLLGNAVATPPVSVYLAHGYYPPTKDLGLGIQAQLEEHGINVINPFQRGEQAKYDEYIEKGLDFPESIAEEIVEMDLAKIDIVDGIVSVPNTNSIGTYMELFYAAKVRKIPCFVLWIHGGKRHPWLQYLTQLYMGDRDALINDVVKWKEILDGRRRQG